MRNVTAELLTWTTLSIGLVWFCAGLILAWRAGIGVSVVVPAVVAAIPAVVLLAEGSGEGPAVRFLPAGADPFLYIKTVFVPLAACILGGHVAEAVNPLRRKVKAARVAEASARRRLMDLEQEITQMEAELQGGPEAPRTVVSELSRMRIRVSSKRDQLREIRRELSDGAA